MASAGDMKESRHVKLPSSSIGSSAVLTCTDIYLDLLWRGFSSATEQCPLLLFTEGHGLEEASQFQLCNSFNKSRNVENTNKLCDSRPFEAVGQS